MSRLFSIILLLLSGSAAAQNKYPQNYFRSPMNIPLKLSGNFGELRPNHFHAGIDVTTAGKEGLSVLASAEGYVTRIKVAPYGYGRVLYVTHANGFVTVYGHLSRFSTPIAAYVEKEQYARESFEVELFPRPGELPVKSGEIIGYSGNTGSSGGPHLHFEIRDAGTEEALNPLLFGLPVEDSVPPVIQSIAVYPLDANTKINGKQAMKRIPVKKSGSKYVFANPKDSVSVSGTVGFAIEGFDQENMRHGKNGVYGAELWLDGKRLYRHRFDRMGFDVSRYINCFIDYPEQKKSKRFLQKSFLGPNNKLPIYDSVQAGGRVQLDDDSTHIVQYVLRDLSGNAALLTFKVKSRSRGHKLAAPPAKTVYKWNVENTIRQEKTFSFSIPAEALYDDAEITYSVSPASGKMRSPAISIGNDHIPLQKPCTLSIVPAVQLSDSLKKKLLIAETDLKGGVWGSVGGEFSDGAVVTTVKEFGRYTVALDSTAPTIKPSNFDLKGTQANLGGLKFLGFTVGDNLSGIGSYRLTIDGKWVLLEYEPKKRLLYYVFDKRVGKGEHELLLTVTDKKGNAREYRKKFVR